MDRKLRKKNPFAVLIMLALLAACLTLCACGEIEYYSSDESAAAGVTLSSISLKGVENLQLEEGQTLTLESLSGVVVNVIFSSGEKTEYSLGELSALPSGLAIDKLGRVLKKGETIVTVTFNCGGVEKSARFSIFAKEKEPEEEPKEGGEQEIEVLPADAVIDGNAFESIYTEEVVANTRAFTYKEDGSRIETFAVKGSDGVYFSLGVYAYVKNESYAEWAKKAAVIFSFGNANECRVCLKTKKSYATNGIIVAAGACGLVDASTNLFKCLYEFFVPYSCFAGQSDTDDEISLSVLGLEDEERYDILSDPNLTVSYHGLRFERSVAVLQYDCALVAADRAIARAGDSVAITVQTGGGCVLDNVFINGELLDTTENGYIFKMPDEDVIVSATFLKICTVDISAFGGRLTADVPDPVEGQEIHFTAVDNYVIGELFVNGEPLAMSDGAYTYVADGDLIVTGTTFFAVGGVVLDGDLDKSYGNSKTTAGYSGNREMIVHAVKTVSGVFIRAVVYTNTVKTDASEPLGNTYFEFQLNGDGQRYVTASGANVGVTDFVWNTQALGDEDLTHPGQYQHEIEIFVEKSLLGVYGDGISFNYAFGASGETACVCGDNVSGIAVSSLSDRFDTHTGGLFASEDILSGFNTYGTFSDKLKITTEGLVVGKTASNATIDGFFDEYGDKTSVTKVDGDRSLEVGGFVGNDGLYLAVIVTRQAFWSPLNNEDWALNDNLQIRINDAETVVIFGDGYTYIPDFFSCGAARTVLDNGKFVTTIELFAANATPFSSYSVYVGASGSNSGLGGWFNCPIEAYLTAGGLSETDPGVPSGLVLDGAFNDEVWSEDVVLHSFCDGEHGSSVTIMGATLDGGIMLGITICHNTPITKRILPLSINEWWTYMNVKFTVFDLDDTFAVSVCQSDSTKGNVWLGQRTVENADDAAYAYTTYMELYVPPYTFEMRDVETCPVRFSGVFDNGEADLFNAQTADFIITKRGLIRVY